MSLCRRLYEFVKDLLLAFAQLVLGGGATVKW